MENMNKSTMKEILNGACFLGSGGGGAYETGLKLIDRSEVVEKVKIVSMEEALKAGAGKYAVVTAVIGSPEKMKQMKNMEMNVAGVKKLAAEAGIRAEDIYCIIPGEIGSVSSVVACLTAAEMGIPVLDADGTGRAAPKLNMTTFAVTGTSVNPTVLTSLNGDSVSLNLRGDQDYTASVAVESLARSIVGAPEFGEFGGFAIWKMPVEELPARVPIRGTLTAARLLGKAIRDEIDNARGQHRKPLAKNLQTVLRQIGYEAKWYAEGILKSAATSQKGGFDHGTITIERKDGEGDLNIVFQNESLLLWDHRQPAPCVVAPDLICYLMLPKEGGTQQWVYSNGDIMDTATGLLKKEFEGAEITVVGLLAPVQLRELESLRCQLRESTNGTVTVGDSYKNMLEEIGFYGEYVPL